MKRVICKHFGNGCCASTCYNSKPRARLLYDPIYCGAFTKKPEAKTLEN